MVTSLKPEAPKSVRDTITWLLKLGRPPLPECPTEAAKQGKEPKAPCFFDGRRVVPINWKHWQNEQPIPEVFNAWFINQKTGIGTLGGWNGKHWLGWIDFDQKDFSSADECDCTIAEWVDQFPIMANAPTFRTPSGGYRFLIAFSRESENFKANSGFSLKPDGSHHVGELLSKNGGHTLLPPTVGVSGKAYYWERWSEYPPVVERPEDVGIYPVKKRTENKPAALPARRSSSGDSEDTSLMELLGSEIYPRLTAEQAFNWNGHDFKKYGDKLKGNCPWHESQSGTSFYAEQKQGAWLWRCPACDIGGSVIEYRHRLRGGNGSPRGRDFVDIARELADEVGVPFPPNPYTEKQLASPEGDRARTSRGNVVSHPTANRQQQPELTTEALKVKLRELIEQGVSQSDIEGLIPELAEKSGRKENAVQRLRITLESELERQQSLADDSTQFNKLIEYQAKRLDVYSIFPEPLAKGLISKATSDRIDPVRLIQNLLPAVGGILGSKVGIVAKEGETQEDHWIERPVIWCVDVGPPSSGKSNANNTVFEPIKRFQSEEAKRYKEACEELKKVEKAWESKSTEEQEELKDSQENPEVFKAEVVGTKRKWLLDIAEIEAVLRLLSKQASSAGITWNKDEFGGLFSGLDQYKSGNKGNARQILLSAWNGRIRIDIDRVKEEDSYSLDGQTLNIAGGMQPAVARELFKSKRKGGEADPDGLQSRILPAVPEIPDDFPIWNDVKVSIDGVLTDLYTKLDKIPSGLLIFWDGEAQKLWRRQWEKFKRGYLDYLETNPAFAYFLGKMPSHLPRLALVLHCIEHCFNPKEDFTKLGIGTLKRAVELASFYVAQFRLLQAATQDEEGQLDGVLLRVWNKAQKKGRLTVRDAQQAFKHQKLKAHELKEIFQTIAQRGYGYLEDEGRTLVADKNVGNVGTMPTTRQQPQTSTGQRLDKNVGMLAESSAAGESTTTSPQETGSNQLPTNGDRTATENNAISSENLPTCQQNIESLSGQGVDDVGVVLADCQHDANNRRQK